MNDEYRVKDSGERKKFPTGAQRDTEDGKLNFTRIPKWVMEDQAAKFSGQPEGMTTPIDCHEPDLTEPTGELVRMDLVDTYALKRIARHLGAGAKKYDDHNWRKGINLARFYSSAMRHLWQAFWGDTSEDHLAAVAFNVIGIMWTEREVKEGRLPEDLGDAGWMYHIKHRG